MTAARAKGSEREPSLPEVTLVRDDALFRAQRAIGIIPPQGLGVGRRAALLAVVTWLPLMVWALLNRRALPGLVSEPLLEHFEVHVRCLVAIPLLVFAEAVAHGVTARLVPHFVSSGLVRPAERSRFQEIVRGILRLRDATSPWVVLLGLVLALTVVTPVMIRMHAIAWAGAPQGGFGFGGHWFLYVVRPVFITLLVAWLWRYALTVLLLFRISRLDLDLVPTHPDRAGGLGFLEGLPAAFSLVALAASSVVAAAWAHEEVYHGVSVQSLRVPMIGFVVLVVGMFLAPLLLFAPVLRKVKRRALLDYSTLLAEHGRLVHRRWIRGEKTGEAPVLTAPELGPVADMITLYESVPRMRIAPIGKRALLAVAVPAALPILLVVAIDVPVKEMLLKILRALA